VKYTKSTDDCEDVGVEYKHGIYDN